jgi:hypothetical protein
MDIGSLFTRFGNMASPGLNPDIARMFSGGISYGQPQQPSIMGGATSDPKDEETEEERALDEAAKNLRALKSAKAKERQAVANLMGQRPQPKAQQQMKLGTNDILPMLVALGGGMAGRGNLGTGLQELFGYMQGKQGYVDRQNQEQDRAYQQGVANWQDQLKAAGLNLDWLNEDIADEEKAALLSENRQIRAQEKADAAQLKRENTAIQGRQRLDTLVQRYFDDATNPQLDPAGRMTNLSAAMGLLKRPEYYDAKSGVWLDPAAQSMFETLNGMKNELGKLSNANKNLIARTNLTEQQAAKYAKVLQHYDQDRQVKLANILSQIETRGVLKELAIQNGDLRWFSEYRGMYDQAIKIATQQLQLLEGRAKKNGGLTPEEQAAYEALQGQIQGFMQEQSSIPLPTRTSIQAPQGTAQLPGVGQIDINLPTPDPKVLADMNGAIGDGSGRIPNRGPGAPNSTGKVPAPTKKEESTGDSKLYEEARKKVVALRAKYAGTPETDIQARDSIRREMEFWEKRMNDNKPKRVASASEVQKSAKSLQSTVGKVPFAGIANVAIDVLAGGKKQQSQPKNKVYKFGDVTITEVGN